MDIELLRTFLEVQRTGHFGRTAENLFITQSTVSARIRLLESTLGEQLFERERNNIRVTAAGQRLVAHAENIVSVWRRARQDVGLEQHIQASLSIAALSDIWDLTLLDWVQRLRQHLPQIALDTSSLPASLVLLQIANGQQDLGFVFEPHMAKNISSRKLADFELKLFSTVAQQSTESVFDDRYIMVDWGTAFALTHAREYPSARPNLRMTQGRLTLSYLLREGGAAYLPVSMVAKHLDAEEIFAVEGGVTIHREIHAIWRSDNAKVELIADALKALQLAPSD